MCETDMSQPILCVHSDTHSSPSCFTDLLCSWQTISMQTRRCPILLETVGHPLPPTTTVSVCPSRRELSHSSVQCRAMLHSFHHMNVSSSLTMPTGSFFSSLSASYFDMLDRQCWVTVPMATAF